MLHSYIENEKRFQIDNLSCYFKQEKEQNKPEVRRQKKLLRYRDTKKFNIEKTEKRYTVQILTKVELTQLYFFM